MLQILELRDGLSERCLVAITQGSRACSCLHAYLPDSLAKSVLK